MKHIVLISCVKTKRPCRAKSKDLYTSDLFRKCLAYARLFSPDAIFILSAKYGLLSLDEEVDPYELTLNTMGVRDIQAWSDRVLQQLRKVADLNADRFTFLAAERYRRFLLPHLPMHEIPMLGLGIGRQLKFLKERVS